MSKTKEHYHDVIEEGMRAPSMTVSQFITAYCEAEGLSAESPKAIKRQFKKILNENVLEDNNDMVVAAAFHDCTWQKVKDFVTKHKPKL